MLLRPAYPDDIPRIVRLEKAPHACPFVTSWSQDQHRQAMFNPDSRYFAIEEIEGTFAGFVILQGLETPHRAIELKRVVLESPGRGQGRPVLQAILHKAFAAQHAHKVWLDVFEGNARARHIYQSLGFREDGVLRDADYRDGRFQNLILMSILETEYEPPTP